MLNRHLVRGDGGVLHYLMRCRGYTLADDTWLLLDELEHFPNKVAEYDAACTPSPHGPHYRSRRRPRAGAGTAAPRNAGAGAPRGTRRVPDRGPV